ncbi:hypothetical protein BX616_000139 [Lobosporangium transversale]|uniref:Uncharacterized protein n=1 Tax=Lobosporangium transversale TaxID=64571 RepID=A0A1Y2GKT6_9FUNG|nr:hypothetical protein BCR41DRAFT_397043 [Lobosporangium transversale]KAF9908476.1 hypothetical protein BX616_000139 [Lobosporangium transversale]ORZ13883.1 hypothetical protein BCR41DRAFT_397043 [Lobosporangium transversale]|eukprot:XP_021880667.1 hypothetical protein BCR41DRAFT_397043 [Lobosporangium transversale]
MVDEEEEIDIDIDIDGDDPDEQVTVERKEVKVEDGKQISRAMPVGSKNSVESGATDLLHNQSDEVSLGPNPATSGNNNPNQASLVDDFQIPDWITQDEQTRFEAGDMDERSRAMIENMLAEEAFYSARSSTSTIYRQEPSGARGNKSMSTTTSTSRWASGHKPMEKHKGHDSKKRKTSDVRLGQTKRTVSEDSRLNAKLSSADLPSHNTRWTIEEDERLREGIRIYGYGNWKAIAAIVGTRNPLQVKNHARHLAMSDKIPHDFSTNTSDGEGLDRRSSAANSAEEDVGSTQTRKRQPRSTHVKRIDASRALDINGYMPYGGRRRARSITSESGNEEFTGSEFGATSGYDTDNDEDHSVSKSPSLSARGRSRSASAGLTTPSPGLRPLYSSLPLPYDISTDRTGSYSVGENEDIDIDIESTDEDMSSRLGLTRKPPVYVQKSKSRSISPFSNSSTRSRLSSEFDSDSDHDLHNDDGNDTIGSGQSRKRSSASSPTLSDTFGSSSDPYTTPNFNTSTSSINSTGAVSSSKAALKNVQASQQQQQRQLQQKLGAFSHMYVDKAVSSPKERRTVSFGAVHVAELKPDLNSYDEDDINSSEDGVADNKGIANLDVVMTSSPLTSYSFQNGDPSNSLQTERPSSFMVATSSISNFNPQGEGTSFQPLSHQAADHGSKNDKNEGALKKNYNQVLSSAIKPPSSSSSSRGEQSKLSVQQPPSSSSGNPIASHYESTLSDTNAISPALTTISRTVRPRVLDKSVITEEEKLVHSEFFCNKASKTPERYQRIRNTIIQAWEKSPSTYLTKTSVRSGLKDCGDVNAIGRVHSWLEFIGVINVGMTASSPGASLARPRNGGNNSSKRRVHSEERGWSSSSSTTTPRQVRRDVGPGVHDPNTAWLTSPQRRRRVRNEKGEWVDEKELEGHVVEHNIESNNSSKQGRPTVKRNSSSDLFKLDDATFFERHGMTKEEMEDELEQERLTALNAKYFATEMPINSRVPKNKRAQHLLRQMGELQGYSAHEESLEGYDPFRLVPLRKYSAQNPAPFRIKVSSDAMLIMDFHSHMTETEVIGLLGGLYDEDERILFILGVFPCRSISTGLQCEMDPESDVEARYFFSSKGFVVVGWYHSHPTFEPNPSIRDIENQREHQTMFRRHGTGVEPFVGVIISPFDPRNLSFLSKFQFLTVSEQYDDHLNCRVPYGFDREITRMNELSVAVFQQLSELVRYYRTYEHRVDLSKPLRKGEMATRLDKLLQSLNHHIFVDEVTGRAFLSKVKELVVRGFHLDINHESTLSSTRAQYLRSTTTPSLTPFATPQAKLHPQLTAPAICQPKTSRALASTKKPTSGTTADDMIKRILLDESDTETADKNGE